MKRSLFRSCVLVIGLALPLQAQIPRTLSYQGVLTDTLGNPQPDQSYSFTFRLYETSTGGNALWSETKPLTTRRGLFNTLLGDATAFPSSLVFDRQYWLSVQVSPDPELSPRIPLASVGYSFRSIKADTAAYALGSGGGPYLPLAGGAMTGAITNTGNPPITMGKGNFGSGNINTGTQAFVAGSNNSARGAYSTVAGGGGVTAADSNSALGDYSTVSGGQANKSTLSYATVGGGYSNAANNLYTTVSGGYFNTASGQYGIVGGGNTNTASGLVATVAGGFSNTAGNDGATVAGGFLNSARGHFSFVGGGGGYSAIDSNSALGDYSTIGGGQRNTASGSHATVGGGNSNTATVLEATVSGGVGNTSSGIAATVGGGNGNTASGYRGTVSGGYVNTAGGGFSTVGGGEFNFASSDYATVPGGVHNRALGYNSFAAGAQARANHDGAVVIASNIIGFDDTVSSGGIEQMVLRADGGFYLTNTGGVASIPAGRFLNTPMGAHLTTGGVWTNASDRNVKENFEPVSGEELLKKIALLPISQWNYKKESRAVKHIGPIAQDFYAAFGLGNDDKTISTIDPAGIALAAIQELHKKNQELSARVAELEALVKSLIAGKNKREDQSIGEVR